VLARDALGRPAHRRCLYVQSFVAGWLCRENSEAQHVDLWTETTRAKYERQGQRYASDVTDGEWALNV